MSLKTEVNLINKEMAVVKNIFLSTVNIIPEFDITDNKILPYGLRAHTRSISWIVEQVITQQTKFHAQQLDITDVIFNIPTSYLHNCIITIGEKHYFVNVKIHSFNDRKYKNDLSAIEKLYMQYESNPNYHLIYVFLGIRFQNSIISFDRNYFHTFTPQFLPINVNKKNKLRAFFYHQPIYRTRKEFLKLLGESSSCFV